MFYPGDGPVPEMLRTDESLLRPLLKTSMRTSGFRRCLSHPSQNGASTRGRWHPKGCCEPVDKSDFIFPRMVQRAVTGRQWEEQYALFEEKTTTLLEPRKRVWPPSEPDLFARAINHTSSRCLFAGAHLLEEIRPICDLRKDDRAALSGG